jgi:hypothetical protein
MIVLDYEVYVNNTPQAVSLIMNHADVKKFLFSYHKIKPIKINIESILRVFLTELGRKPEQCLFLQGLMIYYKVYMAESGKKKILIKLGLEI